MRVRQMSRLLSRLPCLDPREAYCFIVMTYYVSWFLNDYTDTTCSPIYAHS